MKRILLAFVFCFFTLQFTQAQMAYKRAFFEHYTNTGCGYCALYNPDFWDILDNNPDKIHHIEYHPSYPSPSDPFYQANTTENTARKSYYGSQVTGTPTMILGGTVKTHPGSVTQAMVDNNSGDLSPVLVSVQETGDATNRDVKVDVTALSDVPAGNWVLRVAVVEKLINYDAPNGETEFHNVFRKMLPNTDGDPYSPITGSTSTYNYSYMVDNNWDASQIYTIAFVQNEDDKMVINSGSSEEFMMVYDSTDDFELGSEGQMITMSGTAYTTSTQDEAVTITLTTDAPDTWDATIVVDGTDTGLQQTNTTIAFDQNISVDVNITPGSEQVIANYTLTISADNNPTAIAQKIFYVNTGATELILFNEDQYNELFSGGLDVALNNRYGKMNSSLFSSAQQSGFLEGINNIYYNVAWTFPSLTDEIVGALSTMMDNGVNLLITGQDIGWDTWDTQNGGNGTVATQAFYTDYLQADFIQDGYDAFNVLTPITEDEVFGSLNATNILAVYEENGSPNLYPDDIAPLGDFATEIFRYNNYANLSGIRADNGVFKVVYIGVGLEMLQDVSIANEIVQISHDWFYNVGPVLLEPAMLQVTAFMEGTLDKTSGLMRTDLRDAGLLPLEQPFNTAPWNYAGTEMVSMQDDIPLNTVDWVLVEVRDAIDPSIIVAQKAGFLLNDGSVVDVANNPDGLSLEGLYDQTDYIVNIRSTTHLDIIGAKSIQFSSGQPAMYDFSIAENVQGEMDQLADMGNGIYGLLAGDIDGEGTITINDLNLYKMDASKLNLYLFTDINKDKIVTVTDFNLFTPNSSKIAVDVLRYD